MSGSASFIPADADARREIRDRTDINMCVEAGAGTGKTSVLVDRIVKLLADDGVDVRQVAVMTFTEKAAAELAARVRQGLEQALDTADDAERKERIAAAIRGLNHAHIETIHAFVSSLLRERPVEAGLDPNFKVLDVLPAQLAFEQAYSEWMNAELGADSPPAALLDALNIGLEFTKVREAAECLNRNRELLPLAPYDEVDIAPGTVVDALSEPIATLRRLESRVANHADNGYIEAMAQIEQYEQFAALRERPSSLQRAICMADKVSKNAGAYPNWKSRSDRDDLKKALTQISDTLVEARNNMRQAATSRLLHWLQGFVQKYDRDRRNAGNADFDDLLIWARDLLKNDLGVRAYFQDKYRYILVDEFQDTDPLQVQIVVYLCADGVVPDDWRRARVRPGSLFVVGDPKQSIYRFRRADITMYDEVKRHIFAGAPRRIVQNFRSAWPVIDWVNRAFERLISADEGVQPEYVPLQHHPAYEQHGGVTALRGIAKATSDRLTATDVRRYEGEKLAVLIRESIEGAAWTVRDAAGGQRPATYRDVVILVPNRTELEFYEDAFARAGVPYRHEGGRTFFARQEVRELVAVLRALDDPADGVAAIAALRSPACGCSDEDLLLHRAAGGRFDFMSLTPDASGPVADGLRRLRKLAALRHTKPLPEVIRAVLDETRLVEFAMLQPQGEQVAANLLKVIDLARTFAEAEGGGLRAFVRWLKENMARAADETDAVISEETDNVVRIVTVHASKGLEFPIVVFANMGTNRADRTKSIVDRGGSRLHVKLGKTDDGFRTPGFDEAEADEKRHNIAEEMRLLYVAATRAKDRLVVPFILREDGPPPDEAKCFTDWLRIAGTDTFEADVIVGDGLPPLEAEPPIWRRPPEPAPHGDAQAIVVERARWQAEHAALIARAAAPLRVRTASALKPEWDRAASSSDEVRRGRAADFGSAVHALIERAGLAGDAIDELAGAVAREFGQIGRADEMARIARRALASDAVARALRSKRVLQEVAFAVALPADAPNAEAPGLAEGRIDLLFEEDGQIVIADFKTDAVTAADVDARADFYRPQALVYAWAAGCATGLPVREVIFIFARPELERSYPCTPAFMSEAEALMRSPVLEPAISASP